MALEPPTRREILLVTLLLLGLLYLSRSNTRQHFTSVPPPRISFHSESSTLGEEQIPRKLDTRLTWDASQVPETKIVAHVPGASANFLSFIALYCSLLFQGWTIFDKLYVLNGTLYIVSDQPDNVPDTSKMYSKGLFIENGAEAEAARLPTDEDMQIISSAQAKRLFGTGAQRIDGVSVCRSLLIIRHDIFRTEIHLFQLFANDPPQLHVPAVSSFSSN